MGEHSRSQTPRAVHLKDYRPADFRVEAVDLRFELNAETTRVEARFKVIRASDARDAPLVLNGEELALESVRIDGQPLAAGGYSVDARRLVIPDLPAACVVEIRNSIRPAANTSLMGLYCSGTGLCTQCEAEGFRRITYFPDRPDVLSVYTTTLVADKSRYPVLLSNGNRVAGGELARGRHWARWHDPFPKPSYLFALVAGDFGYIEDEFVTASGRRVRLYVYAVHRDIDQCAHAMESLKRAMRWDEQVFGREYDLDCYMIVAVDDFNMGAMENKGLNIFNSKYILARPETATDADYVAIDGVVGHEYFHNWSGNRVTCRDWFQLSLKEGFTVFRDQQFSADIASRGVKRIHDVDIVRTHQFHEDAGPMAHPVQPESYVEINNFYTLTVYNKGAEVIRMLHTLLGAGDFRRGTDLYFQRHDGQAVTVDEFIAAMEDAGEVALAQFKRWYTQAGTPLLKVDRHYDAATGGYTLTVTQSCPPSPGQADKLPFHIPLAVALFDRSGHALPLVLDDQDPASAPRERVLEIREAVQQFTFTDLAAEPVPSLLRGFSAPVRIDAGLAPDELRLLMAYDTDPFNRWDAGQRLAGAEILRLAREGGAVSPELVAAFAAVLEQNFEDIAFQAEALSLPSEMFVADQMEVVDAQAVQRARIEVKRALAQAHHGAWLARYRETECCGEYRTDAASIGRRRLRNVCLGYLLAIDDAAAWELGHRQYAQARNMTDRLAAFATLVDSSSPQRQAIIDEYYAHWKDHALVIDKWFAVQARSHLPDTLERVRALASHEAFNIRNPNKVRALIGTFCLANPARFHAIDGSGYNLLSEYVLSVDALNPQVAARLVSGFSDWRRYDDRRQGLMRVELERIAAAAGLSADVGEIVTKSLG